MTFALDRRSRRSVPMKESLGSRGDRNTSLMAVRSVSIISARRRPWYCSKALRESLMASSAASKSRKRGLPCITPKAVMRASGVPSSNHVATSAGSSSAFWAKRRAPVITCSSARVRSRPARIEPVGDGRGDHRTLLLGSESPNNNRRFADTSSMCAARLRAQSSPKPRHNAPGVGYRALRPATGN
jgi:hypothetical protein